MDSSIRILRAAWVVPVSEPPIPDGEVVIEGDRILAVRPSSGKTALSVEDFGAAILLPGLVNVHTHLDYTVMRGLLEDMEFFPWIRQLTTRAAAFTEEDWIASAKWGAAEAVAGGVTSIGDCTFNGAAFTAAHDFGMGGAIFIEVFGIDESRSISEIVSELQIRVEEMKGRGSGANLQIGISPHAPYTVRPALMRALAEYAREQHLPICIHAAESQAESDLLQFGEGPFAEMYERRGIAWSPPGRGAVAYLDDLGIVCDRTLLVHGVQVSAADRDIVRERGASWAHCPKSNAKLGAGVAPLGILCDIPPDRLDVRLGRVGLGSDSVGSNNTMDMFEEMRFAVLMQRAARRRIAAFGAREALEMATIGGARALGIGAETGTLQPGKRADLCVVRLGGLHSTPAYDPYSALVYAARASDVICTVIAGELRFDARFGPNVEDQFPANNLTQVRLQLQRAAQKMREWRPSD